jgi:hypothetical protein
MAPMFEKFNFLKYSVTMSLHLRNLLVLFICVVVAQAQSNMPLFKDYRGVKIGMSADEVRGKLDQIKKGEGQDYLVFSDEESAQIYYDSQGKVTAISIDYFNNGKAPSPDTVLGTTIQAKDDGSMYQLNRYPDAGYWVSYNRTAGDKPIVTITMQKM